MQQQRAGDIMDEMSQWCQDRVDDGEVKRTTGPDGQLVMECQIETDHNEVKMSIDERNRGQVKLMDHSQKKQEWKGDISDVDFHEDGATMVGEQMTFSFQWD
jgi:hypothetical protein